MDKCKLDKMKKVVHFHHSYESVFNGVKEETTYLAQRTYDKEGKQMFDELVFDEEYPTMFRTLFLESRSRVIKGCSAFIKDSPEEESEVIIDASKLDENKDFEVDLHLHIFFKTKLVQAVNTDMKSALVYFICYKWLMNKLPLEAERYLATYNDLMTRVRALLEYRAGHRSLKSRWY